MESLARRECLEILAPIPVAVESPVVLLAFSSCRVSTTCFGWHNQTWSVGWVPSPDFNAFGPRTGIQPTKSLVGIKTQSVTQNNEP